MQQVSNASNAQDQSGIGINPKGKCDGCGISPRALKQIESGQWVCRNCLREIRGPKEPKITGICEGCSDSPRILKQIESGQRVCSTCLRFRSHMLDFVKSNGKKVSNNISMQELDRLNQITELQNKGVSINDDATFSEIEEAKYGPPKVIHFFTKIVGTTFNTNDGTSRQTNLAKCQSWEKLKLVPEPDVLPPFSVPGVMRVSFG
jgi:Fe-S cluster biogenesis protein NfuA